MSNFTEGQDFYYDDNGMMVLTSTYHLKRGKCCANACKHCPYRFEEIPEPRRSKLLLQKPPIIFMGTLQKNN
jgi:hypothetical protein